MADSSKWSEMKKIAKRNFGWWVEITKIESEDSFLVKFKKVFIKIIGVCSLIVFSPIYIIVLILAFVIAL